MTNQERFSAYQDAVNKALDAAVIEKDCLHGKIFEAMRYSLNAGGKRIRPILALEFARIFGVSQDVAMPFAVALEMIHTYSLIHDDLPCMDDDDMRRGRPTSHKVFGEAIAVLAGDALLNYAFEYALSNSGKLPADTVVKALCCLAASSGADGMIGGQVIDIEGEMRDMNMDEIETLQSLKTGAIIRAGAQIGCILGNSGEAALASAEKYADLLGLAFQMKDDILNVEGDPEIVGKDTGNDERSGKSTFVKLLGLDTCKKKLFELTEGAVSAVKDLPDSEFLVWLAYELSSRNK